MLRSFFLSLFFCISLLATSLQAKLDNFDANFLKASPTSKQAFHQELKALYIKSVMDGDKEAKTQVLKRLIISSNLLLLSDKAYVKELLSEGFLPKNIKAIKDALALLQADIKAKEAKAINDVNSTTKPAKEPLAKEPIKEKKEIQKIEEKSVLKESLVIKAVNSLESGVKLSLNRSLDKDELKKFVLKKKGNYRSVIDIKAVLATKSKELSFKKLSISISQYDPKTVRIVLRTKTQEHFKLVLSKNSFQVSLEKPKLLTGIKRLSNGLNLSFNYHPNPSIREFIRSSLYYAIISLEGKLEFKNTRFKFKGLSMEVKQFDSSTIKVILKSSHDFELRKVLGDEKLFIGFKQKPPKKAEPTVINSILKSQAGAILAFSGDTPLLQASSFKSKKQSYQILTFKARLKSKRENFSFKHQELSILQYNQNTVRVVLKGKGKLDFYIQDGKIILSFLPPKELVKPKLITIDAGHGGKDSGAISGGKMEKDIVLAVALKLGKILKKRGFRVYYTRTKDVFINLRDRTQMANDKGSDLFISIHANALANKARARKVHGIETFFLSPARSERSKEAAIKENQSDLDEMNYFSQETFLNFLNREKIIASNKLAIDVQRQVLAQLKKKFSVNDGGVREAPFWVLVGAGMPSILIELGYITHPVERKLLFNQNYQKALALGIANGVQSYFKKNP